MIIALKKSKFLSNFVKHVDCLIIYQKMVMQI